MRTKNFLLFSIMIEPKALQVYLLMIFQNNPTQMISQRNLNSIFWLWRRIFLVNINFLMSYWRNEDILMIKSKNIFGIAKQMLSVAFKTQTFIWCLIHLLFLIKTKKNNLFRIQKILISINYIFKFFQFNFNGFQFD